MEWINLKDRKPSVKQDVLFLSDSGVIEGYIDNDGDINVIVLHTHGCGCCSGDGDVFTHWALLPDLPN